MNGLATKNELADGSDSAPGIKLQRSIIRRKRRSVTDREDEDVVQLDVCAGKRIDVKDGPAQQQCRRYCRLRMKVWEWIRVISTPTMVATFLYAISFTVSTPILPFMARRHIDLMPEVWRGFAYGTIMSGYYLTKMIAAPLLGFLSDSVGRRYSLFLTLLGSCVSFLITLFIGQHSFHGILLCRLLMGSFAANGSLMMAYIGDTVPRKEQAKSFALHSAAFSMASVVAVPILSILEEDVNSCLLLASVCMALSACVVVIFFSSKQEAEVRHLQMRSVSEVIIGFTKSIRTKKNGWKREQIWAMLSVLRVMLSKRLVICVFALQVLRPAEDLTLLVAYKFNGGAKDIAMLSSVRSAMKVFLPMTPALVLLSNLSSGSSEADHFKVGLRFLKPTLK